LVKDLKIKKMTRKLFSLFQIVLTKFGFVLTRKMYALGRERLIDLNTFPDYVRFSSLELVAEEIKEKKIEGAVAELGVYQGKFEKEINKLFPHKKLYLFDTFEGFDKKDSDIEVSMGYSKGNQDFSNTSIEKVMSLMQFPLNCIIKKGYFPETAVGLEETFSFISIDTDLFEPIYNGLAYFYPRVSKGGYIFVHDYNDIEYSGAKKAVRKYCQEMGINYFPLSDGWGTCVIAK
jgi:O-methyltransferase